MRCILLLITSAHGGKLRDGRFMWFCQVEQLMSSGTRGLGFVRSSAVGGLRTWTPKPAFCGVSSGNVTAKLWSWASVSPQEGWMMMGGTHLVGLLWDINELMFGQHVEQCVACRECYIYIYISQCLFKKVNAVGLQSKRAYPWHCAMFSPVSSSHVFNWWVYREARFTTSYLPPPYWRPGPQPKHVPWLGVEPAPLWFAGQHSIHTSQGSSNLIYTLNEYQTHSQ